MNAKKCDRCGKLYEKNSGIIPKQLTAIELLNEQKENRYIEISSTPIRDLCPDCCEQLIKWLRGE